MYLKKFVLLVLLVTLGSPVFAEEVPHSTTSDGQPTAGHLDFGQLPDDKLQHFLELINQNLPLGVDREAVRTVGTPFPAAIWKAPEPVLAAGVVRAVVRFKRPKGFDRGLQINDTFDVAIDFLPDAMVVRHSRTPPNEQKKGIVITPGSDPQQNRFIKSDEETTVVLMAPAMPAGAGNPRGVFLCPRKLFDVNTTKGEKLRFAVDTRYRVTRGLFAVKSAAYGKMPDEFSAGTIEASISTSPTVSRSVDYRDEKSGSGVEVKLEYAPLAAEQLPIEDEIHSTTGGVEAMVTVSNGAGLAKSVSLRDVVWIREVDLPRDRSWTVQHHKNAIPVSPGPCYVVMKQNFWTTTYSGSPVLSDKTDVPGSTTVPAIQNTEATVLPGPVIAFPLEAVPSQGVENNGSSESLSPTVTVTIVSPAAATRSESAFPGGELGSAPPVTSSAQPIASP